MTRLFELLRRQRRALLFGFAGLAVLGVVAGFQLPAAILPEVTFPRIKIIADSGERSGDEMLRAVTRPLEQAIRLVPGVRQMRSTTSRGSSEINLDCDWGSNMELTLQRVNARLDALRFQLPAGTSIEARLMSPALFPVVGLSLTSKTRSLAELRDFAVTDLQPELARLPGVAEVVVQGGRRLEARVTLDAGALAARGLDADRVAEVLRKSGELESLGLLEANRELYLGLADARPPNLAALEAIPIPVTSGPPVRLGALGRVSLEEAPEFTRYAAQSSDAVLVSVLRQPSASTIGLADALRVWFREHKDTLPSDVRFETFYDQSDLVRASLASVRDSLLVGAIMAGLVVVLILGSLRLGLAGAVVLPWSIGLTLLGFALTRQSLNMMTLGGIAAAVGLVLDDAIIVVEHLSHRVALSTGPPDVSAAMAEIFPSLIGSSACTIAIFVPFMFLGGVAGAFFKVLALAMILMLTASLVLCVTIIPLQRYLPSPRAVERESGEGWFPRALRHAIRHAWTALVPAGLLLASIVPLKLTLGSGFLPEMDEGSLILDYASPPGTSLTETDRVLRQVEGEIAATPEILAWSRRTGNQLGFFITEPNFGDYVLRLREQRKRSADEVADDLRRRIEASQPALQIEFGQLVEDVIGDLTSNPQPIEVRVFGEERRLTEAQATKVAAILEQVRGVVDVKSGVVVSGPNISLVPGPQAARLGLAVDALTAAVKPAVSGLDAGQIVRGTHIWPVRVLLAGLGKGAPAEALADVHVPVGSGPWVRLGELASIDIEPGETEIGRQDQRTMVSVTARLTGRDLGSAMAEVQRRLRRNLPLPPSMSIRFGGLWAEQQSSFRGLAAVLLGATAAVVLILVAAFRSWRHTGAVMLVVVTSLSGVLFGLHLGGATFNISSFVGAIMMVGVVAENAYFLVASHREFLRDGHSPQEAAIAAASRRARPVLMTTAAGVAALSPLALGIGTGSALLRPLALAVVGGFLTSALLLLVVLPVLLARAGTLTD